MTELREGIQRVRQSDTHNDVLKFSNEFQIETYIKERILPNVEI